MRVGVSSPPAMLKSSGRRRNFLTMAALLTTLHLQVNTISWLSQLEVYK